MKKIITMFLMAVMLVSLVACGKTVEVTPPEITPASSEVLNREFDQNNPAAVLEEIKNDFINVSAQLNEKLEETFDNVGATYEEYQKNKGLVAEWIELVLSESDALFARTKENSIIYFKLIADDEDHKYSEFCDDALDEYYDAVYDEAMDEYYDALYDEAMDDLYDEYYGGIIDDAYDEVAYKEWSSASSECYKQWSDTSSAIYKKWSSESSYIYGLWSAMNSAFCWNDNFDVDAIVAEYDKKKAEEGTKTSEETSVSSEVVATEAPKQEEVVTTTTDNGMDSDDMDTDFKEAMDSYEKFMDGYIAFMKKYKESNGTDLSILTDYAKWMSDYAEVCEEFASWESQDLSAAELSYYLEVQTRVTQKLLEVAY